MTEQLDIDYFANHERARKFPWSLYHRPIEDDLTRFLTNVAAEHANPRVLVIGCGLLHERDRMPASLAITVADIDERAVKAVTNLGDPRVREGIVLSPDGSLENVSGPFDAIYAKELIEHVVSWQAYLCALRDLLAPNGQLWLSTPNYGEPWLFALESTILEWVARRDGFSRKDLHPSKLSRRRLETGLRAAGLVETHVRVLPHRLAIVACARRPQTV